jgi:rare lipoprotein A
MVVPALALLPACAARNKPSPPAPPASTPAAATAAPATTKPAARQSVLETYEGLASYYGPGLEGKVTASGATFDKNSMVAAHPSYPFGTLVRVTNLANGRAVIVRVVDRGPAKAAQNEGVLIDLSSGAARNLGFTATGRTKVKLEVLRWGQ